MEEKAQDKSEMWIKNTQQTKKKQSNSATKQEPGVDHCVDNDMHTTTETLRLLYFIFSIWHPQFHEPDEEKQRSQTP